MQEGLLPIFPLEVVLLPHTPLPLHIFEERYKEMIGECLDSGGEFGVVLAKGGGVLRVGCTASIEKVLERHDDGRLDILTLGQRRFEIESIDTERSYFRAHVAFFDDDDYEPAKPQLIHDAIEVYEELARLTESELEPPDSDHPELSFLLAHITADLGFRQTLLQIRSEAQRMERVAEHLRLLILRQKTRDEMKKIIRANGHGKHLPPNPSQN